MNKKKNIDKKAQLETMEQIIVIMIVIIGGLIVFGIFFKINAGSAKVEKLAKLEQSAVEIAQLVSGMPELACTRNNVVTANCVNLIKAEKLKTSDIITNNIQYYHTIFGFSKITLQQVYPSPLPPPPPPPPPPELVIYDNKPENTKFTHRISTPILIYDPSVATSSCFELGKGTCNYGYLSIEMYT